MNTELTASQLRTHAASLEKAIKTLTDAEGASQHIKLGSESYGLLCQFLPPIMDGRHSTMDELFKTAKDNLRGHASNLRDAADDLTGTDHGNAQNTEDASKGLDNQPVPQSTPHDTGDKPRVGRR